jgi:hypothetical protein
MNKSTERLLEMTRRVESIKNHGELAMKQFQIAADAKDKAAMEEARIAAHEHLDQLMDFHQELVEVKDQQMDELIRIMKGKPDG